MVRITVDGKDMSVSANKTILEALRDVGVNIPHLCNMPGAEDAKRPCLLCMVEVEGEGRVRACNREVSDGMVITAFSKDLEAFRKSRLELLAKSHYGDCRAPCNLTCPGGINVQGYVNLIATGEYEAALRLIREKNPLPLSVGRVCPRFCETRCRRVLLDEHISINDLKRFVADYVQARGGLKEAVGEPTGKRVAIIGGGPAGLSCAYYLRKFGHEVTIFEAEKSLGGLLRFGIPGYKLPNKVVDEEVQNILDMGVRVKVGKRWGDDFTLQDLKDDGFDSIFVAVGLSRQKTLDIKGGEFINDGLSLLKKINTSYISDKNFDSAKGLNASISKDAQGEELLSLGKKVLIIGGGDIAIDCARSARRLGVRDVTVVYERSRVEMPCQQRDVEEAEKEGVQFFLMAMPLSIERLPDGRVKVLMARTVLGEPDEKGRRFPVPMPGSRLFWEGDAVISALGQEGDDSIITFGELEARLKLTPKKTIKSNPSTMATNLEGIYAGGDCASGPRSVIQAVAAGRRAAEAMHQFMTGKRASIIEPRFNFNKGKRFEDVDMHNYDGFSVQLSQTMPSRPPERRIRDFFEAELGLTEEMAREEARRCLECGCLGLSKCTYRELCVDYKVNANLSEKRKQYQVDSSHPFIEVDPNKCIGCSRCERSCKYDALQLSFAEDEESGVLKDISIKLKDNCVSCGACVDNCPTGALSKKGLKVPLWPEQLRPVKSVCTYCGTGCSVDVIGNLGAILEIRADRSYPPNYGDLCVKGRFGFTFYNHPDRLKRPLIREAIDSPFKEVSWEEALGFVARRLKEIRAEFGADAIGVLASSRCTNEENFLFQKFARAVIGTNNVDNCARV